MGLEEAPSAANDGLARGASVSCVNSKHLRTEGAGLTAGPCVSPLKHFVVGDVSLFVAIVHKRYDLGLLVDSIGFQLHILQNVNQAFTT